MVLVWLGFAVGGASFGLGLLGVGFGSAWVCFGLALDWFGLALVSNRSASEWKRRWFGSAPTLKRPYRTTFGPNQSQDRGRCSRRAIWRSLYMDMSQLYTISTTPNGQHTVNTRSTRRSTHGQHTVNTYSKSLLFFKKAIWEHSSLA